MSNVLEIAVDKMSSRPNHLPGGGGALNAGYTPVDALARITNTLGLLGLEYGKHFYWSKFDYNSDTFYDTGLKQYVVLTFSDKDTMLSAKLVIESLK